MKNALSLFAILALILTACEGPQGPMGPPGFDSEYAKVVEVEVDMQFVEGPDIWEAFVDYPNNVEFLDGDAVLVYRLEDVINGQDVWTPLPHNFFFAEGTMQYLFTHTIQDIQFVIDGNFDVSQISTDYTDNQIFRYVLVPTEFAQNFEGDLSDINQVMGALDIQTADIQKIQ